MSRRRVVTNLRQFHRIYLGSYLKDFDCLDLKELKSRLKVTRSKFTHKIIKLKQSSHADV